MKPATTTRFFSLISIAFILSLVLLFARAANAREIDCLMCHGELAKQKVVHAAVSMGCPSCHSAIDAADIPHKKTNTIPKGLSSEQPDLCYACHDKTAFTKTSVHAAVGMGCTGCHNPHSSKNEKLLLTGLPDLCFNCHDKSGFSRKNVHAPVAGGMCMSCHGPHSSDAMALLLKRPFDVCIDCHPDVVRKPHAVAGMSSQRHPLGGLKQTRRGHEELKDPSRPGKPFYCGSCHDPHSTDGPHLFRFNANTTMGLCSHCHKM